MKSKKKILLDIKKLCVSITENSKNKKLIKSVSFNIKKNEIVGLIGESGSGKSLTSLCILGLLEKKNFNISGEIYFNQRNIINLQENQIMKIRGSEISMIFQEPMTALNPTMKIGEQLFEVFRSHENIDSKEISSRIEKLIKKVLNNFDNGVQEKIEYDIYPNPLDQEYKRRRSECARDMYTALSIEQDDIELRLSQIRENFKFFGAPVGMIVTIDRAFAENAWGHVGMFIQNICLSAVDNDMGTCLQESWSIYPKTVKDFLNIPDNEVVWCGIALGYPNKEHPINNYRTSRESIEKFVTFIE